MKGLIWFSVGAFVSVVCFLFSGMFFVNSGVFDDDFYVNEIRISEIIRAFDEMPFVVLNHEDITFHSRGEITQIDGNSFVVKEYRRNSEFNGYHNISDLDVGDRVYVSYFYDENNNKVIDYLRKYLDIGDVIDYDSCSEYGGDLDYHFPRSCAIGQVTFVEDVGSKCESLGGSWLESFSECEGISMRDCYDLDGEFFECESACRNDPDAEICIMMCVQVCKFDYYYD